MQMAVDETRRRHGAATVNHLPAGEPLRDLSRLVDGDDLALVYCDRCVANDAALGIDRDQPIDLGDEQVDGLHAGLRYASGSALSCPRRRASSITEPAARNVTVPEYVVRCLQDCPLSRAMTLERLLVLSDIGEVVGDFELDQHILVSRVLAQHGAV